MTWKQRNLPKYKEKQQLQNQTTRGLYTRNRSTTLNEIQGQQDLCYAKFRYTYILFLTSSVPIVSQWVHPETWKVKPLLLLLAALCVCKKHCQGNKPFVMSPRSTNTFPWSAITPAVLTYCGDKIIGMTTNMFFFQMAVNRVLTNLICRDIFFDLSFLFF